MTREFKSNFAEYQIQGGENRRQKKRGRGKVTPLLRLCIVETTSKIALGTKANDLNSSLMFGSCIVLMYHYTPTPPDRLV